MNMLVALLATRAFVIVSPETDDDTARAAQINHQVRAVLRAHRADTFRVLSLSSYLSGKRAPHGKLRKQAAQQLEQAHQAYGELDVEGAIKQLEAAQGTVSKALASRKGTPLWLRIRLELGLRLWELDKPEGRPLVEQTLQLHPKTPLPPGTQLSDEMAGVIDQLRAAPGGQRAVRFESASRVHVEVGDRTCVTPCTLEGLPSGDIPWRATGTGIMTLGGVHRGGDTVRIEPKQVPKRAELLSRLEPLWTAPKAEADVLLSDLRKPFAAPQFLWLRVGAERIAALRGRVVPKGTLFYRGVTPMSEAPDDDDLLGVIKASLASDATVGAPVQSIGLLASLGKWWKKNKPGLPKLPSLPKLSLPKVSPRTMALSGATLAGTAAITGVVMYLSAQPPKAVGYDPILGF